MAPEKRLEEEDEEGSSSHPVEKSMTMTIKNPMVTCGSPILRNPYTF